MDFFEPFWADRRLMIAPKGASMKKHGPYTFKPPQEPLVMRQEFYQNHYKPLLTIDFPMI